MKRFIALFCLISVFAFAEDTDSRYIERRARMFLIDLALHNVKYEPDILAYLVIDPACLILKLRVDEAIMEGKSKGYDGPIFALDFIRNIIMKYIPVRVDSEMNITYIQNYNMYLCEIQADNGKILNFVFESKQNEFTGSKDFMLTKIAFDCSEIERDYHGAKSYE